MRSHSGHKESAAPESLGLMRKVLQGLKKCGPLLAFLTLVVNLVRVYIDRESLRLAAREEQRQIEAIERENRPTWEFRGYVAFSPDLLDERDQAWIGKRDLTPFSFQSRYWSKKYSEYIAGNKERYVFIMILNRGPGVAKKITISISWSTGGDASVPDGVGVLEGPLGELQAGQLYAVLIHTLASYDPKEPLLDMLSVDLCVLVQYEDASDGGDREFECFSEMAPLEAWSPF